MDRDSNEYLFEHFNNCRLLFPGTTTTMKMLQNSTSKILKVARLEVNTLLVIRDLK